MKSWELVNYCEFDKYASQSYCAIHNEDESKNLGDINFVDEKNLKAFNMICGGSPCFVAGTLVLTDSGYKPIESIHVGDFVLTRENHYRKVTKTTVSITGSLYTVYYGFSSVTCTPNHPLWVKRIDGDQEYFLWVEAHNLDVLTDWVGSPKEARKHDTDVPSVTNLRAVVSNDEDWCWYGVSSISVEDKVCRVYNLEVEEDHSYCVNGIISHNCQDFSVAGKGEGSAWTCKDCGHEYNPLTVHYTERKKCPKCGSTNLEKTRSSLLVEWLRVIEANKPNFGIYENVKNLVGEAFRDTFQMFLWELHEYGYNTYYKVLNAKDYGVPQNRERVFVIFIKKELDNGKFVFPKGFDNGKRLKDVLLDSVDEKYYINTPQAQKLIDDLVESGKLEKLDE